jgi:pimeloyl-ACP methyl ester carboxylesterase
VIAYDASVASLLHPEGSQTLFQPGVAYGATQLGVEMARLAYYDFDAAAPPRLAQALAIVGFTGLQTFTGPLDTQAFAARRAADGMAVIAFRGTQPGSLADIGVDLSFRLSGWTGAGRVHEGFRDSFHAVRGDIEAWIAANGVPAGSLLVCGHSLGGALATLAASAWKPAHMVTIGSPRVGDAVFAQSIPAASCRRIFNCCDAVARLPPRTIGYEHVEPSTFIDAQGRAVANPGGLAVDLERHRGRADFFASYAGLGNVPTRDLADHAPINYLRAFFS